MGLFNKKEEKKEEKKEVVIETELDKLIKYIDKNKDTFVMRKVKDVIKNNYKEGITDIKKCHIFIDFCNDYSNNLEPFSEQLEVIYHLLTTYLNTSIIHSLLKLCMTKSNLYLYINYIVESRSYFSDDESWYARVYEVLNFDINTYDALEEDKMRIGIYPNIDSEVIVKLNKEIESIKNSLVNINNETKKNEEVVERIKNNTKVLADDGINKIDSTYRMSISEIQNFTNDSINRIKRILNIDPTKRSGVLKEVEKELNCIDAFDENISIKKRYEDLIALKNKSVIYHPKFDEVLKYFIAGNTINLNGPEKCGKTELVRQISELVNLYFYNLGNIYDEVSQIKGYYDFNTNYNKPVFQQCFENGGIVLIKNTNNAPFQVLSELNNIIKGFSYNSYVFGNNLRTMPSKNFRLVTTNRNNLIADNIELDNVVNINMEYDVNFEKSLSEDKKIIEFLHDLRSNGVNITTNTIMDITSHLKLGLLTKEEILNNYIVQKNSKDLLIRKSNELNNSEYSETLKKVLKV